MTMESACLHEPLPLPEHTVRRETPDGGQAAVTLYPVFPGVPAHDSRDYAFAKHFGLEIRPLV